MQSGRARGRGGIDSAEFADVDEGVVGRVVAERPTQPPIAKTKVRYLGRRPLVDAIPWRPLTCLPDFIHNGLGLAGHEWRLCRIYLDVRMLGTHPQKSKQDFKILFSSAQSSIITTPPHIVFVVVINLPQSIFIRFISSG